MTLAEMLERAAARHPAAEAVVDGATRLTYADLARLASRAGAGFARLGVRHGDRVLLALRNRVEHVVAYWGLQTIGAIAVPVNFRLAAAEMQYVLQDAGAKVAVFERSTADAVLEPARSADAPLVFVGADPPPGVLTWKDVAGDAGAGSGAPIENRGTLHRAGVALDRGAAPRPADIALILYTSGTTGRPKGVPRTHANHHAGALAQVIQLGWTWGERTLGVMPLYHTMGIHALIGVVAVNGCFVCQPEWSAARALALIADERLTSLYLIPTLFHDLVRAAPELARTDVTSVRKLAYAGAPMLGALTEACVKVFAPDIFVNHYGSTEIYTFSVRPNVHEKPGCAGRPGVHSTLRVVTASTERRVGPDEAVAAGEKGEIIARLDSDEAFAGYWNRPDADAKALRAGWYFTGDMGYVDDDGELWVSGRVDDMIISGGENIHPVEVEEVVARHPGVADVAVVGEADERWGERVVAFVVARDAALSAEALDRFCRESPHLASFKRPRRIVFVADIPKTASGKILRRLLRDGQYTEIAR